MPLWEGRDGQRATVPPGPLFDRVPARPKRKGPRRHKAGRAEPEFDAEHAYRELLGLLRNQQAITSSDAQQHLGATAAQVRPVLKRLVDDGHALKEGKGRGMKYRFNRGTGV